MAVTISSLERAANQAAERIRAAGFVAKANNFKGSISLQVQVEPGDRRIAWHDHTVHVTPYCRQTSVERVAVTNPVGFSFNCLNGMYYLSYSVRKEADTAVFAHLMCGPHPVRGPRSMTDVALRELEGSLCAA